MPDTKAFLDQSQWRLVGPFRAGRSIAVVGHPSEPLTFYFGACAGGVWRTRDAGTTWHNISDGYFTSSPVGALAIADSDHSRIYAATGESTIRGDVTLGDGVYRSDDGGDTWRHIGLADTRHIAQVRVHPRDENLIYAGALGHAFGDHDARGVYRSKDGGDTWENVLYVDDKTGVADLSMDTKNPNTLFAAFWQMRRYPWALSSGGPGSGLYKTTDGGDTWTDISSNPGLPSGLLGRIGVVVSPVDSSRVWALVEHESEAGLYRSDNGGDTWELINRDPNLRQRPWYYMHVFADPVDIDKVYVLNLRMWKSIDGGLSFSHIPTPHGDNHGLWIDPENTDRMIEGNDGGACVSFDAAKTWSSVNNQPTAQFYHVTTDTRFPYRIYGAQQDNTTISVPSFSWRNSIVGDDSYPIGGGESGYIAVRPDNPDIVYAGSFITRMTRYDHSSQQAVEITVWPEDYVGYGSEEMKYRFQWTFPIVLSPHDPEIIYTGGQFIFKSTNGGDSWEKFSPDLTRADPETLKPSGGPITKDNIGTEIYATVFAIAESPVKPGVIWAGSDDGLVHVTQDNGETWTNVTPGDLDDWPLISIIEPSPHDAATAYMAITRYKLDDNTPYLYRTHDYGKTWERITNGIREDDFTRVIREDPVRKGLLYAGTETGVYVSWNNGDNWHRFQANLPIVPIHDLTIKDTDLILGTHGRAFWSLDDLTPIREWDEANSPGSTTVFPAEPAYRIKTPRGFAWGEDIGYKAYIASGGRTTIGETVRGKDGKPELFLAEAGHNPPDGAIIHYWLSDDVESEVKLTFLTANGEEIRTFSSKDEGNHNGFSIGSRSGLHRFVWDLRYPPGVDLPFGTLSAYWGGGVDGPQVVPGNYKVRLDVNGETHTAEFEVRKDPRLATTQEDYEAQFDLLMKIRNKLDDAHKTVLRGRELRDQIEVWRPRLDAAGHNDLVAECDRVIEKLASIESEIVEARSKGAADSFNYPPKVNSKLSSLQGTVSFGDARPPKQQYDVWEHLSAQADRSISALQETIDTDVKQLNEKIASSGVPAIG
ncbi:MAG: glycosyl hydrolase [Sphaerobacteraceae bacterium]|nr:MAG: glycosyl hydrolase [Sphaerobacteraceae bacterium]